MRQKESLTAVLGMFDGLYIHYSKKKWGMMRMDNDIHKRNAVDRFFETMKGRKKGLSGQLLRMEVPLSALVGRTSRQSPSSGSNNIAASFQTRG